LKLLIFRFAKIYYQKRFNDRSNGFPFGQQPVYGLDEPGQDSQASTHIFDHGKTRWNFFRDISCLPLPRPPRKRERCGQEGASRQPAGRPFENSHDLLQNVKD
jgi:hypothetical protein